MTAIDDDLARARPVIEDPDSAAESGTASAGSRRLTLAAGVALIAIAAAHLILMSAHGLWPAWLAGELRTAVPGDRGIDFFWAGIGGFAVPVAILGAMIIRTARQRRRCSPVLSYALLGWAGACCYLLGPSGFLTFLVPAVLLILADVRGRLRR